MNKEKKKIMLKVAHLDLKGASFIALVAIIEELERLRKDLKTLR